MICVLKENIDNLSDKEINNLYDKIYDNINKSAEIAIDDIIESLNKLKNTIAISIVKDELGSWFFDISNGLDIPSKDDENRLELINALKKLQNQPEKHINSEIHEIIEQIFKN